MLFKFPKPWQICFTVANLFQNRSRTVPEPFQNWSTTVPQLFKNRSRTIIELFHNCWVFKTIHSFHWERSLNMNIPIYLKAVYPFFSFVWFRFLYRKTIDDIYGLAGQQNKFAAYVSMLQSIYYDFILVIDNHLNRNKFSKNLDINVPTKLRCLFFNSKLFCSIRTWSG